MKIHAFDKRVYLSGNASDDKFLRLPESIIAKVPRLLQLSKNTSGLKLSFISNTKKLRIYAEFGLKPQYANLARPIMYSFELYVNNRFTNLLSAEYDKMIIDQSIEVNSLKKDNTFELLFPLYNAINEFYIETDDDAYVRRPEDKKHKPILFYGSSITQGANASRPGTCYTNLLSRLLDVDIINLGFSGNALGDIPIVDYIGSKDISIFVYDYDHNANETKYLRKTHEAFFNRIRDNQPKLPVVIISRPDVEKDIHLARANRKVIMDTYINALNKGDDNVYFIDGYSLFNGFYREACTVDGVHPNDTGFLRMAENIYPVLKDILEGLYEKKN